MCCQWFLETDIFNEGDNHEKLKQEIEAVGDIYTEFKYVPFGGGIDFINNSQDIYPTSFIMYGSLQSAKYFQIEGYADVWMNLLQFKCSYYYPRFGKYLFQSPYVFMPYGDILRNWDELCRMFDCQYGGLFIRPDSGFKLFTGTVIEPNVMTYEDSFYKLGFDPNVLPETMCVVAKPKRLTAEYRFIIGAMPETNEPYVVTGCKYKDCYIEGPVYDSPIPALNKQYDPFREEILSFVRKVISEVDYQPNPFWVLDVAEEDNCEFSVLEVGSFSCSGFYGCEIDKIVRSVSSYLKFSSEDF